MSRGETFWYPTAFSAWSLEERAALDRVHASGRYTMGAEVEALEAELAAYHGRLHAVTVSSGSSANLVLVAALHLLKGLDRRWRAAVPALAWATTYAPLVQHGVTHLSLLDCDDTWCAVPEDGAADLVVACPVLGSAAGLERLERRVAARPGAILVEDACESLGARTETGRLAGTFGLASTVSFFYSHQVSAIEGGAILTDDAEVAEACRLLRNHGNAGWGRSDPERLYEFTAFGYNVRPLELHAAVAREQLKKLDRHAEDRRLNARLFREATAGVPVEPQRLAGTPAPFGLAFLVESADRRRALFAALRAARIDARLPTGGSFRLHPYGEPWRDQPTPFADEVHRRGLFLGCAPFPIPGRIDAAVKVMREVL